MSKFGEFCSTKKENLVQITLQKHIFSKISQICLWGEKKRKFAFKKNTATLVIFRKYLDHHNLAGNGFVERRLAPPLPSTPLHAQMAPEKQGAQCPTCNIPTGIIFNTLGKG